MLCYLSFSLSLSLYIYICIYLCFCVYPSINNSNNSNSNSNYDKSLPVVPPLVRARRPPRLRLRRPMSSMTVQNKSKMIRCNLTKVNVIDIYIYIYRYRERENTTNIIMKPTLKSIHQKKEDTVKEFKKNQKQPLRLKL